MHQYGKGYSLVFSAHFAAFELVLEPKSCFVSVGCLLCTAAIVCCVSRLYSSRLCCCTKEVSARR